MRQHEPQAMTFTEVLPVHVNPHINKHRKSESERKRKKKATRKSLAIPDTKQNEYESSLFIKREYANQAGIELKNIEYSGLP